MDSDFAEQRLKMVDGQVRTTDVTAPGIIAAMLEIPREQFVPARRRSLAYIDEDIELTLPGDSDARFLMEPSPFAKLVQLADVGSGDFVLDVGCATGYSAAVLSRLASSVIALECDAGLAAAATENLSRLGYDNVVVVEGPLQEGYAPEAPYDVIFVGGAVDEVPAALFDQLKDGGRLVAVTGSGNSGVARIYVKDDGIVSSRRGFNAAVRALPGFHSEPAFEF